MKRKEKDIQKYKVIDKNTNNRNIIAFFNRIEEAEFFVRNNNGKRLNGLKSNLEIEETDYYRDWKTKNL